MPLTQVQPQMAAGGPAFSATLSSNQTLAFNTLTRLPFNTETFDTNNCYDPTTNYRFTPNVAGYYLINSNVKFNGTFTRQYYFDVRIFKNGSLFNQALAGASIAMGNGQDFNICVSSLVNMNGTTDYIEIYAYQYDYTASGTMNIIASTTSFDGFLARAA